MTTQTKMISLLSLLFLGAAGLYVTSFHSLPLIVQTVYLFFPVFAVSMGIRALIRMKVENRKAWMFLVLGIGGFAIGELLWYVFSNFLGIDPFPSIADFFFLAGYPLIAFGLWFEFRHASVDVSNMNPEPVVGSLLAGMLLAGITVYFGVYLAYDPTDSLFANIIAMLYGVFDLFLIMIALWVTVILQSATELKDLRVWKFLTAALVGYLVADVLFAMYRFYYLAKLTPYVFIDLMWILGYIIFTYIFWHVSRPVLAPVSVAEVSPQK